VAPVYFADAQRMGKVSPVPENLEFSGGIPLFKPLLAIIVRHWLGQEIPSAWLSQAETRYRQVSKSFGRALPAITPA